MRTVVKQLTRDESGSGFVPAVVGFMAFIAILNALILIVRLNDAQVRLRAIAQDGARLIAGIAYQQGQTWQSNVTALMDAELGTLAPTSAIMISQNSNLIIVQINSRVDLTLVPGVVGFPTTVTARAAIEKEPYP